MSERCPKVNPVFGDVVVVPGAGPIGNPLRFRVRGNDGKTVKFSTAMGDGEVSLADWREDMDDESVTIAVRVA